MNQAWNPDKVRVQVARDLREIVRLWRMLPEEAEHRALGHDAGNLDALNLAGPAANLEAWEHRYETAERLGRDTWYGSDQVAELHPLLLLGTWEDAVRDERDQPTDLKATVERAADYLGKSIDWMLGSNEYGDLNFLAIDQLADDLSRCRRMLEDVTNEGIRKSLGAPCEGCGKPLERVYALTEDDDRWWCDLCQRAFHPTEYVELVTKGYRANSPWLSGPEASAVCLVSEGTIRKWAQRGHVKRRKNPQTGRVMYLVEDIRTQRDTAATATS